ncbi:MAG: hypothetical protein IJQ02_09080 [Oscillospiraceae bacterium]|nr:hypothetical protein [Oscillospiraceae bacterium]
MLKLREGTGSDLARFYSALQMDFDERELFSPASIRKAMRSGAQEFLIFYDDQTSITEGYALCCTKSVYGYVLLKYFGILPWYRDHGVGVEAMRLLHKRYADRQGILAELTVFEDSEDGEYLRKLKRFFARFGYTEVPFSYRIGGAKGILTAKPLRGTAEIAPIARRLLLDFYSRCLRPAQLEKMLAFDP